MAITKKQEERALSADEKELVEHVGRAGLAVADRLPSSPGW